jgi:hypothetical protein
MKEESLTSSVQEFVREDSLDGTKRLDFVAYRRAQRQRQLMEAINRKDSIKIVGRRIEKPSEISIVYCYCYQYMRGKDPRIQNFTQGSFTNAASRLFNKLLILHTKSLRVIVLLLLHI